MIPAHVRDYLYPVLTALVALLAGYGLITEAMAPLWASFGAALLGLGTATAYRPAKTLTDQKPSHRA